MSMLQRLLVFMGATLWLSMPGQGMERISLASRDGTMLAGYLARPAGAGPFPAVVAMHGCAGLWSRSGDIGARESDWSDRLVAAGYVVLFPDSFRPRGLNALCNDRERGLTPRGRVQDALGARDWLAGQSFVAAQRIGLIGWSNGGSAVLHAANDPSAAGLGGFRAIVAFYPGCRVILRRGWTAKVPTTILHGLADDWTPAAPCEELARQGGARFVGYAGAFHDFDHPSLPPRERKAAFSQRPDGLVTIGTHAGAREQAIAATMAILRGM